MPPWGQDSGVMPPLGDRMMRSRGDAIWSAGQQGARVTFCIPVGCRMMGTEVMSPWGTGQLGAGVMPPWGVR